MRLLDTVCGVSHLLVRFGEVYRLTALQSLLRYFNYTTK